MVQNRPPIIVIMGHVDHGKTTLLDYIRKSNVASREAGGITQHIHSFQFVTESGALITFIDTPGHAAFAQMRSRGSRIADLAILVVASDDGVMPQTRESIKFIKESGIPFIVAFTKSDLPAANPDHAKTQLTEEEVVVEEYGGTTPSVSVSAKTGAGIPDLLELIALVTELNPPQADPEAQLEALVLESRLDPKKGPLATVIVKNGTLLVGQSLFTSVAIGKARSLTDPDGKSIKTALPSQPVEILGLSQVPEVGTEISTQVVDSASPVAVRTLAAGGKLNFILRADVAGSLEAIVASLDTESGIGIIEAQTGDITEGDILLARTSQAQVLGFNVKASSSALKLAEVEKVTVKTFRIIYELLEYLHDRLHPKVVETVVGKAEVLAQFKVDADRIAGCKCTEGLMSKSDKVRIMRGDVVVGETRIKSLHQGKSAIEKVKVGQEFGAIFSPYLDFKVGDNIIALA